MITFRCVFSTSGEYECTEPMLSRMSQVWILFCEEGVYLNFAFAFALVILFYRGEMGSVPKV